MEKTIPAKSKVFDIKGVRWSLSEAYPDDMTLIVVKAKGSKSLRQLRGLFGVWFDYLSEKTGYTVGEIHASMKYRFLGDIYLKDPQNNEQLNWAELMVSCESSKSKAVRNRISLSWATLQQMLDYMEKVAHYAINKGYPLPEMDRYHNIKILAARSGKAQKVEN